MFRKVITFIPAPGFKKPIVVMPKNPSLLEQFYFEHTRRRIIRYGRQVYGVVRVAKNS